MISTHVLDTSLGLPATGMRVALEQKAGTAWRSVGAASTDADGRVKELLSAGTPLARGVYRLHFDTGGYFAARSVKAFYPSVTVEFEVADAAQHHHVPLLLTPFGYSTYRGT